MEVTEVIKALEDKLNEKGFATNEQLEAFKAQIEEVKGLTDQTELKAAHDALELEIQALKDRGVSQEKVDIIKAKIESNKDAIAAMISKGAGKVEFELTTKAVHNPTDIADREQLGQYEAGTSLIPYQALFMQNLFPTRQATREFINYQEHTTTIRDAKGVIACTPSTHTTKLEWGISNLQMKKLRDMTDVCQDMMDDYDFVQGEVRDLISTSLQLKKDHDLLLGDGIGGNINGVASYAATFNSASPGADYTGTVENAQLIDLLVIAGAQIKAFGGQNFFMPNVIVLNPKDATLMGLLKDGESNYIKSGTVNAAVFRDNSGTLFINGMRVVENANCPENEAFVMDTRRATLYNRRGVTIEFAYENRANFEHEMVTVKAYERLNLLVKNNDANAFLHITNIASGITSITMF